MCQVLVVACEISSLTMDRTQAPCIGNPEAQPLDHQGSPTFTYFIKHTSVDNFGGILTSDLVLSLGALPNS